MFSIRMAFAALVLCVALPAAAVVSNSYSFSTQSAVTGADTWNNALAGYNAVSGTDYGNVRTFTGLAGATPVTVSAWGSTGGTAGFGGTLQSAYVGRYGTNELGVTSRSLPSATNIELNSSFNPNTGNNQHAMDNTGAYESLLFSFQSSVTLNDVSIGFPPSGSGLDSDATVLVYTGSGDPTPNLSVRTYSQLLSNGWQIAGNLFDLTPGTAGKLSTSLSSKYWMVGAFMNIGGNTMIGHDNTVDFLKVSGLTVTPRVGVPEPGTLALVGIAAMALMAGRRKGRGV